MNFLEENKKSYKAQLDDFVRNRRWTYQVQRTQISQDLLSITLFLNGIWVRSEGKEENLVMNRACLLMLYKIQEFMSPQIRSFDRHQNNSDRSNQHYQQNTRSKSCLRLPERNKGYNNPNIKDKNSQFGPEKENPTYHQNRSNKRSFGKNFPMNEERKLSTKGILSQNPNEYQNNYSNKETMQDQSQNKHEKTVKGVNLNQRANFGPKNSKNEVQNIRKPSTSGILSKNSNEHPNNFPKNDCPQTIQYPLQDKPEKVHFGNQNQESTTISGNGTKSTANRATFNRKFSKLKPGTLNSSVIEEPKKRPYVERLENKSDALIKLKKSDQESLKGGNKMESKNMIKKENNTKINTPEASTPNISPRNDNVLKNIEQKIVEIPKDMIGLIIGENGEKLKLIGSKSNASIAVSKKHQSNIATITIKGSSTQIQEAEYLIENSLKLNPNANKKRNKKDMGQSSAQDMDPGNEIDKNPEINPGTSIKVPINVTLVSDSTTNHIKITNGLDSELEFILPKKLNNLKILSEEQVKEANESKAMIRSKKPEIDFEAITNFSELFEKLAKEYGFDFDTLYLQQKEKWICLVEMKLAPIFIAQGRGDTREAALDDAILAAILYLNLLSD